ncbi:MAG: hypothetical protein NTU81_02175 [Candidatus Nomurabacteria bacterium]|nr:hypothetical protein [Candidatus Nomurabacteria bacterium]
MKIAKIILFIFSFFILGTLSVSATTVSGSVTVVVIVTNIPTVTLPTDTSVTTTTATLGATVSSLGDPASISARGICWGTTPAPTTNCSAEGGTTLGLFTKATTGLPPATLIYYRGYATNTTGTGYSTDGTFTTATLTNPTGTITASNCTIALGASTCLTTLVWSTTNPIGTSAVTTPTNITVASANSSAGTTYIMQYNTSRTFYLYNNGILLSQDTATAPACASGSWNGSHCAQAPTVVAPNVSGITQSAATLGAIVTSLGYPTTITRGTCFGTSPAPTTNCYAEGGTTTGSYSHIRGPMTQANTLYYYRGYATNATGTSYTVDGTFTTSSVTISVVASPTTYNVLPSSAPYITYTPTTNTGTTQCELLDYAKTTVLAVYQSSSPITSYVVPSSAGAYGYYIRCKNNSYPSYIADSSLITINVITVNISATTPYNVAPGTSLPFTYVASTNPVATGFECRLLDNLSAQVFPLAGAYKITSPITYTVPNSIGSYGYYINCRNTTLNTAVKTSSLITVNTACASGSSWSGSACVAPSGSITASNCNIATNGHSCTSDISWSTTNPIGTSAVTTPSGITVATANSSSTTYPVFYGSRNFYLYNNAVQLGTTATANATCTPGVNSWNGTSCVVPTSTLSFPGCTIPLNSSSCMSTPVTWSINNGISGATNYVKNAADGTDIITPTTATSGSTSYLLTLTPKTFTLSNGASNIINSVSPIAVCANTTHNSGGICVIDAIAVDNTVFTTTPDTIFKGRTAVLDWDSPLATSCTGVNFSTGVGSPTSGSLVVSPIVNTTYTLNCTNSTGGASLPVTTKVITLQIKEN